MALPVKPSHYALLSGFLDDPNTMRMRQTTVTNFHLAMVVNRGKIIAVAGNRIGSRARGCGYADYTIHAEKNVIKHLGDHNKIRGCEMFVMRIQENRVTGAKTFGDSKPCSDCQLFIEKCQRVYGLRNVYYTNRN